MDDEEQYRADQKEAAELEAFFRSKNPSVRSAIWCALNILISTAAESESDCEWYGSAASEDNGPIREWKVTVEWSEPLTEIPEA